MQVGAGGFPALPHIAYELPFFHFLLLLYQTLFHVGVESDVCFRVLYKAVIAVALVRPGGKYYALGKSQDLVSAVGGQVNAVMESGLSLHGVFPVAEPG